MSDADVSQIPHVYTLTSLTRSAGQSRRVVIAGFDAPLRGVMVTAIALLVAAIPTILLWVFVGPTALLLPALAVGAAFYLVEGRTRNGLHLRTYQAMIDKKREAIGQFICCGQHVQPRMSGFGLIVRSSMPSPWLVSSATLVDELLSPDLPAHTKSGRRDPTAARVAAHPRPVRRSRPVKRRRRGSDPFAVLAQESAQRTQPLAITKKKARGNK